MAPRGEGRYIWAMQNRLPLAIIEDQAPIREMLHQYLHAQPEFECVLIAVSMEDFFRQLAGDLAVSNVPTGKGQRAQKLIDICRQLSTPDAHAD